MQYIILFTFPNIFYFCNLTPSADQQIIIFTRWSQDLSFEDKWPHQRLKSSRDIICGRYRTITLSLSGHELFLRSKWLKATSASSFEALQKLIQFQTSRIQTTKVILRTSSPYLLVLTFLIQILRSWLELKSNKCWYSSELKLELSYRSS